MLERKTQNLPRPAIKANLFLLLGSPLSSFLFNNWIHTLEDLNLTMSTPLVVEHVPFFFSTGSGATVAFCQDSVFRARLGSETWTRETSISTVDESLYFFVDLCRWAQNLACPFVWVCTTPSVSCDLLFLHRKLLLGESLESPQGMGVWLVHDTNFFFDQTC